MRAGRADQGIESVPGHGRRRRRPGRRPPHAPEPGRQRGGRWSLTVVTPEDRLDGAPWRSCAPPRRCRHRRRIRSSGPEDPAPSVTCSGSGSRPARGRPRALLFPGDVWAPDTVALLSTALTPTGVVYADEDVVTADGTTWRRGSSPTSRRSSSSPAPTSAVPLAMGAAVADHLPRLVASRHGCARARMRAGRHRDRRDRDPHRRGPVPPVRRDARRLGTTSVRHVEEALSRRGDHARVDGGSASVAYRIARTVPAGAPVSILIPFRDEPRLLRTCVDSLAATTSMHTSLELVLIDNGSTDPETLTLVERLADSPDVRVLTDPRPFNWAALNNAGALAARGDILVFLNNDIEARQSGWLSALCAQALRPDVGAAGARLLYPDLRLQHCGLVVGLTGAAGHVLGGLPEEAPGYLHMATATRECSAVTGACLATRRDGLRTPGRFRRDARGRPERRRLLPARRRERPPHVVRARSPADPPRVAQPGHGGRRRRRRQVRRSMEGVHFRRRPLLEPSPHPCGSVVRIGSPRGGG